MCLPSMLRRIFSVIYRGSYALAAGDVTQSKYNDKSTTSCLSKKIQRQQYLGKRFTGFLWIPHAKGASTSPVFPKRTSNSVRTDHFHILALEFGL